MTLCSMLAFLSSRGLCSVARMPRHYVCSWAIVESVPIAHHFHILKLIVDGGGMNVVRICEPLFVA
jgi:hypothetical protein